MEEERERFYSRLATIPGMRPMPSVGNWVLVTVDDPGDFARKVNRRMTPGLVTVPRHVDGAVRVPVKTPKDNEEVFRAMREVMEKRLGALALEQLGVHEADDLEAEAI